MKVLVFSTLYPNNVWPNHGVFVKERMTRVARQAGHDVRVVAPVPWYPRFLGKGWRSRFAEVSAKQTIEGVEVYHPRFFMIPKIAMFSYGLTMFLSVLPAVRRLRKTFDFDLIDAHYIYPDGYAATLLGRFFGKPVVVSARGSDINQFAGFRSIRGLLRTTMNRARGRIAVCSALRDAMAQLEVPADSIAVIPNGVDVGKFEPIDRKAARSTLSLPDVPTVLSVGELIPRKGFHLLIEALAILRRRGTGPQPHLVVAGEGQYRPQLESLIQEHGLESQVRLVGAIPHRELKTWYSAADVFCLASDREGWPNVILESMACGTPVVATRVWGIPEIVTSDTYGLLMDRTSESIAAAISAAFDREWDRDALVAYAGAQTWEKVAENVTTYFDEILTNGTQK